MKYLIILLVLLYNLFSSQIKVSWSYSKIKGIAEINVYNTSNQHIVLPLDVKSLKPYQDNQCSMNDYEFPYPILALTLSVNDGYENIPGNISNIEIPDSDIDLKKIVEERENNNNEYTNIIEKWSKKNKLKDLDFAKINHYLVNNLIILKPKGNINFRVSVDFDNITNEKYIYYYYPIDWTKKNEVSLTLCINADVYNYLTELQKQKLRKYNLFTGSIQSNIIKL